jgi:hypothetical protein
VNKRSSAFLANTSQNLSFFPVFMMNMPIDPCHNSSRSLLGVQSGELQVSCMDSERLSRTTRHEHHFNPMYEIITIGRRPSTACIEHIATCTDTCQIICARVTESQLSVRGRSAPHSCLRKVSVNTRLDDTCVHNISISRVMLSHYPCRIRNQLITDTRRLRVGHVTHHHLVDLVSSERR